MAVDESGITVASARSMTSAPRAREARLHGDNPVVVHEDRHALLRLLL